MRREVHGLGEGVRSSEPKQKHDRPRSDNRDKSDQKRSLVAIVDRKCAGQIVVHLDAHHDGFSLTGTRAQPIADCCDGRHTLERHAGGRARRRGPPSCHFRARHGRVSGAGRRSSQMRITSLRPQPGVPSAFAGLFSSRTRGDGRRSRHCCVIAAGRALRWLSRSALLATPSLRKRRIVTTIITATTCFSRGHLLTVSRGHPLTSTPLSFGPPPAAIPSIMLRQAASTPAVAKQTRSSQIDRPSTRPAPDRCFPNWPGRCYGARR